MAAIAFTSPAAVQTRVGPDRRPASTSPTPPGHHNGARKRARKELGIARSLKTEKREGGRRSRERDQVPYCSIDTSAVTSLITCFPAFKAASVCGTCSYMGVDTKTRSMSESSI